MMVPGGFAVFGGQSIPIIKEVLNSRNDVGKCYYIENFTAKCCGGEVEFYPAGVFS